VLGLRRVCIEKPEITIKVEDGACPAVTGRESQPGLLLLDRGVTILELPLRGVSAPLVDSGRPGYLLAGSGRLSRFVSLYSLEALLEFLVLVLKRLNALIKRWARRTRILLSFKSKGREEEKDAESIAHEIPLCVWIDRGTLETLRDALPLDLYRNSAEKSFTLTLAFS